ncbi:MAG: hypothetical protein DRI84_00615 [Bacteroidetes bacterium]|nr:MAG: hypothetical protein DRI84_00615 [Bacteroidota bacterium]
MKIIKLNIEGMTCPSCSASLGNSINELKGIESKYIDHATDLGRIEFDENQISEEEIITKINEGHYKVIGKEHIKNELIIPDCPECKRTGKLVPNTIFKAILNRESQQLIDRNQKNYICMNTDCNVAYYTPNSTLDLSHLRREIWFKKSSKKNIICYCNNIDREQIEEVVKIHGLQTWEEITSHYRSKVVEKCEQLNPTGSCCRDTFAKSIESYNVVE